MTDGTVSQFDKVGEAWATGMKEQCGDNLLKRVQGQYTVNTEDLNLEVAALEADIPTKNNNIYSAELRNLV